MSGSRGLRGLFRRQPNFGSVLDAGVLHHDKDAYTPTETIAVVPDETLLMEDPEPEPGPEPESLPHNGYAIGPQSPRKTRRRSGGWTSPKPPATRWTSSSAAT